VVTAGDAVMARLGSGQLAGGDCARSVASRWLVPPLPWAVLTFAIAVAAGWPKTRPLIADSIAYRALALHQFGEVGGSIAGRMLHPETVRFTSWAAGLNVDQAFFVVALATLALFIWIVAWILKQVAGFGALVVPLLGTPLLIADMFGLYYCQDLFYAALLGCFFAALMKGHTRLALALLFPLFLTRESTILLALVWAGLAWFEADFFVAGGCIAVTIAGLAVSRMFASAGMPNVHHTNELVFLALKPPFDSIRNLLGIVLIPTEMKGRPGFTCAPFATLSLPSYLRYGFTKEVGICAPMPEVPLHTVTLWLSLFGTGPAIVCAIFKDNGRRAWCDSPLWLKVAALYGLLAFCAAPAVSDWLERDIGYGWPLFWLAAPALFIKTYPASSPAMVTALLVENLAACWIPYALGLSLRHPGVSLIAAFAVALAMQVATLLTLRLNAAGLTVLSGTRIDSEMGQAQRTGPMSSQVQASVGND
jgi:hypothetical protein